MLLQFIVFYEVSVVLRAMRSVNALCFYAVYY